ncbi:MFS transporter [Teredinibacter purpureus]|uniref:MFS transporter n=1 Tax=Teredinibacter purpureus TaxID=2731756 RepID=UPI0005F7C510|nr:MFS transporter [Teredinibacter purpureus]
MFTTLQSLPKNIWVLAFSMALLQGAMPLLFLIGGILGAHLAPSPDLATLPMATSIVGLSCATIPAAMLARFIGRKNASFIGIVISIVGINLCAVSAWLQHFYLLLAGTFLVGASTGFYQQFRFAAIESLQDARNTGPALSVLMMSGIVAGVLGPELSSVSELPLFAPLALSKEVIAFGIMELFVIAGGIIFFVGFKNPDITSEVATGKPRPLMTIVRQPLFLTAMLVSVVGYAVMAFLMTSTPISMHLHDGHSMADSKWIIQSHVVAMFLPSLVTGFIIKHYGAGILLILGSLIYLAVIAIATNGQEVIHYWWALVLLGIGWNFLFVSGTSLLPNTYQNNERFKAQAFNDFTIFGVQAIVSLLAGWVLFSFGWTVQLLLCLPFALTALAIAIIYWRRHKQWL